LSKDERYYIRGLQQLEGILNVIDKGVNDFIENKENICLEMTNELHEPTKEELELYNKATERLSKICRKIKGTLPYHML
jgi:hypothetical protein